MRWGARGGGLRGESGGGIRRPKILRPFRSTKTMTAAISGSDYTLLYDVSDGVNRRITLDVLMTIPALAALIGQRGADISAGTVLMTTRTRRRITAAATAQLPVFAADDWCIVEFGAADGTTQTLDRNTQTIDGAAENNTTTDYGAIVLYYCNSVGAVVSKKIGQLPS